MAKLEIELSAEEAAHLQQEAQKAGLPFAEFARHRLLSPESASNGEKTPDAAAYDPSARPIWEIAAELGAQIPAEERAQLPRDLSINYKHYLYGYPREEA